MAAYGAGMVIGALGASRIVNVLAFGHAVLIGPVASVVAAIFMVATFVWPFGALAGIAFFLFGAGPIVWTVTTATLRQTVTPASMLGCVTSIFLTVNTGARPLGAALGGWIGSHWDERACLLLALVGFGVQATVILLSPVRRLARLPAPVLAH